MGVVEGGGQWDRGAFMRHDNQKKVKWIILCIVISSFFISSLFFLSPQRRRRYGHRNRCGYRHRFHFYSGDSIRRIVRPFGGSVGF